METAETTSTAQIPTTAPAPAPAEIAVAKPFNIIETIKDLLRDPRVQFLIGSGGLLLLLVGVYRLGVQHGRQQALSETPL